MLLQERYREMLSKEGYDNPLTKQEEYILDFIDNAMPESIQQLSFFIPFVGVILYHSERYQKATPLENLRSFLEDMQQGGCQSGIIGEFVYNSDCKDFYIKHIDDIENAISNYESDYGIVSNTTGTPRYTFAVWFVFENFCDNLLSNF